MTNKKLWLSLLVVVLVVCMLSVTLFACNKDDSKKQPTPAPGPTVEAQAIDAIINGIKASVEDGDMTDLKVDGTVGLTLGDKEYALKLALELDLLQFNGYNYEAASGEFDKDGEYFTKSGSTYTKVETPKSEDMSKYYIRVSRKDEEHANTSNTKINAELKDVKANETLFGVYYWDSDPGTTRDPYQGNALYLQAKTKEGQKKVYFPAPYVAKLQNQLNGQVDFHGIDLADEDVWGSVDTVTGIIAGLASEGVCTSTEASITLKIGDLLDPNNENNLLSLVSGLQDWLDALDLDIDATALGELLPNISLVLSATLDNGKATGFDITLKLAEKDMEIKNKSKDHTVIKVNMDKDVEVGLSLDYTIGTCTPWMSDFSGFVRQENILDVALSADLYLSEAISMSFNLNGKALTIAVPEGEYTLSIALAANPWVILDDISKIKFDNTANVISSIKTLLQMVNCLDLQLIRTADGSHVKLAEPETKVSVFVGNLYIVDNNKYVPEKDSSGNVNKYVRLSADILTGDISIPSITIGIDGVLDLVMPFIPKSGDDGSDDPSSAAEDETTKLLQTIGGYLLGAYIGINDGTNGALFASFDSALTKEKMIPFSGYTEWTGTTKNPAFTYYKQTAGEHYDVAATYAAGTKYYVLTPNEYVPVPSSVEKPDEKTWYYTRSGTEGNYTYTKVNITEFATDVTYYTFKEGGYKSAGDITKFEDGVTYYTYTEATYAVAESTYEGKVYVKGKSDGGDFGIGLSASLKIDNGIEINATITNMDFMGLARTISAKISNLKISIFQNDFKVFKDGTGAEDVTTYSHLVVS